MDETAMWYYITLLIVIAVIVLVFGTVVKKAGFSRSWSLLIILPFIGLIMIWVFAFIKWPAERTAHEQE